MVIDFRCERCGKLLRAPAETAGRQSRCPSCGNVQTVPDSSTGESAGPPPIAPPLNPQATSPFATSSSQQEYADPNNPYAAPVYDPRVAQYASATPLQPTRIDIGTVMSTSWAIFRENAGMVILATIIAMAITWAISLATSAPAWIAQFTQVDQALIFVINLVGSVVSNFFNLWILLGLTRFGLGVVRGQGTNLNLLFSATLWQWLYLFVAQLLLSLALLPIIAIPIFSFIVLPVLTGDEVAMVVLVVSGLFVLPIVLLSQAALILLYFIIADRDVGPIQALRMLIAYLRGNALVVMGLMLLSFVLVMFGFLALCVGALVAIPYVFLIWTVAYLLMTGQAVGPGRPAYGTAQPAV